MTTQENILARIAQASDHYIPDFSGPWNMANELKDWRVYIVHDPCHDTAEFRDNRNTVIAMHKVRGVFKILGRELPMKFAKSLARGRVAVFVSDRKAQSPALVEGP